MRAAPHRPARWRSSVALLTLLVAAFYVLPLLPSASIQFDTANLHYPAQKYIADRLGGGIFPFWTPYLSCGYPLTANPTVGAWYPLNWPFFLLGITPRSLEIEIALHAWIACLGAYFFIARHVRRRAASLLGALAYGLSAFFTSQAGHPDLFMAAAWFPWLLLFYRRSLRSPGPHDFALGVLTGGLILATGSLAGALFALLGLAFYAAALTWPRRAHWRRPAILPLALALAALPVAAAILVPAWQFESLAAPADHSAGALSSRALLTLLYPNAFGTLSRRDTGRILEHDLYAGFLLLPLAVLGAWKTRRRLAGLALLAPVLLYLLPGRLIPGIARFGPPSAGWFVPSLGLSLLAAAGADCLARWWGIRFPRFLGWTIPLHRAIPVALAAFSFVDLWCWNLAFNPLAYARQTWAGAFGRRESVALRQLVRPALPLSRFDPRGNLLGVGPALYPLDLKFEITTSYLGPQLLAYRQYRTAMLRNPRLRDSLNANRYLGPTYQVEANPDALPRAWIPPATIDAPSAGVSLHLLESLDPHALAIVESPHPGFFQDPHAELSILAHTEQSYLIRCLSATPALMALSVAWYPGWQAVAQNHELPVLRVDHALLGVVVPAGNNLVRVEFHPEHLGLGLWTSAVSTLLMLALALLGAAHARARRARRKRRLRPAPL